jgi:hypothetical protein
VRPDLAGRISQAMRVVSTRVLPLPAPARISACCGGRVTAASCSGLRLASRSDREHRNLLKSYLERMSKIGMTLEIELGVTGGEEDGVDNSGVDSSKLYTQPEDVAYAYERLSKISPRFTIAASFGNVHGVYKPGNVKLQPSS